MYKKWTLAAFLLTALPLHWVMAQENAPATSTTSTTTSAYEQQKQDEEIRGLRLQNDKLEQENRSGKAKAIVDALPTSPTTGAVTVKDGAGQAEANVLALGAASQLAEFIALRIKEAADMKVDESAFQGDSAKCKALPPLDDSLRPVGKEVDGKLPVPVMLISGADTLSFSRWDQFRFRACKIATDYPDAIEAADASAAELRGLVRQPGGSLVGPANALSAAVKLAQLALPDWELAPLQTTVANRPVLLEVARAYREIATNADARPLYWQGAVSKLGASARIFDALDLLNTANREAEAADSNLGDLITKAEKALGGKKPPAGLEAAVARAKISKAALDAVIATHAGLLKDLFGGEAASPLPVTGLIDESAAASLIGSRGIVASINVESHGGTSAARKVLWNAFDPGSPPLFISGTVSISYAAVRPADQQLLKSGAYSCSTGPVKLRRVPAAINPGGSVSCGEAR